MVEGVFTFGVYDAPFCSTVVHPELLYHVYVGEPSPVTLRVTGEPQSIGDADDDK